MESMPAPAPPVTVGVDTHLDQHVAAVVDQTDAGDGEDKTVFTLRRSLACCRP